MTPKEKADKLIENFIPHTRQFHEALGWEDYSESAKQCALIAVDEILLIVDIMDVCGEKEKSYEYWEKVKSEIKKI